MRNKNTTHAVYYTAPTADRQPRITQPVLGTITDCGLLWHVARKLGDPSSETPEGSFSGPCLCRSCSAGDVMIGPRAVIGRCGNIHTRGREGGGGRVYQRKS